MTFSSKINYILNIHQWLHLVNVLPKQSQIYINFRSQSLEKQVKVNIFGRSYCHKYDTTILVQMLTTRRCCCGLMDCELRCSTHSTLGLRWRGVAPASPKTCSACADDTDPVRRDASHVTPSHVTPTLYRYIFMIEYVFQLRVCLSQMRVSLSQLRICLSQMRVCLPVK